MSESYDNEPSFSLNDFKKWMAKQQDAQESKSRRSEFTGLTVESKIGLKRLLNKIKPDEGDLEEMAKDFRRYGGVILESDEDHNLLVEVDSGTFTIPRFFVRKKR